MSAHTLSTGIRSKSRTVCMIEAYHRYARVGTAGQDLDAQLVVLTAAGSATTTNTTKAAEYQHV